MRIYCFKRPCYGIDNSLDKFKISITCKLAVFSNVKFISDDMIIFNERLNKHLKTLELLFSNIYDLNLKINKAKCIFRQKKLLFFGIEISESGTNVDPNKTDSLRHAEP